MSKAFFFPVLSGGEVLYRGFQGGISHGMWRDCPAIKAFVDQSAMTWTVKCGKEERHLRLGAHNTKHRRIASCVKRQLFLFLISPIKALQGD